MGKETLYLLGAGASCNALPLVSQFPSRMGTFKSRLEYVANRIKDQDTVRNDDPIWTDGVKQFSEAIEWLTREAFGHASVDTYAKKLFFLQDRLGLHKLKAALSAYLVIEQAINSVDKRYDAFFASALQPHPNRKIALPEHLSIITWNYDTQLEKAFYGFCEDSEWVQESITFSDRVYRINGYCGTLSPGRLGDPFRAVWEKNDDTIWEIGLRFFLEYMAPENPPEPDIRFAWEPNTQQHLNNIISGLNGIKILVVIGYSFPYFNRDIDGLLLSHLKDLHRIYLQYPEGTHATISERLQGLGVDTTIASNISATDLFHIPNEF